MKLHRAGTTYNVWGKFEYPRAYLATPISKMSCTCPHLFDPADDTILLRDCWWFLNKHWLKCTDDVHVDLSDAQIFWIFHMLHLNNAWYSYSPDKPEQECHCNVSEAVVSKYASTFSFHFRQYTPKQFSLMTIDRFDEHYNLFKFFPSFLNHPVVILVHI